MKTFLFSIARNLALKQCRDTGWLEQLDDADTDTRSFDPRKAIDIGSAVAAAVASLPPLQQEAIILFEHEGVTLEELAKIVEADVGTVKSRLHRARARLKRILAPCGLQGKANGTF